MKNIYATIDDNHNAILFTKAMVKKYLKFFPEAKFEVFKELSVAFNATKPPNYNSLKIYGVKEGLVKGLFFNYEDFYKFTYKIQNSIGKRCQNIEVAYNYIYSKQPKPKEKTTTTICPVITSDTSENIAYVDGSYYENLMGIAYTIHHNNNSFSHSSFIKTDKKGSSIKAELISAMMVVDRAMKEGLKDITIVCDNEQIFKIVNNGKCKNSFNQKYYNYMLNACKTINISFKKVKSHSGDAENDNVDRLAKHSNVDKFIKML